MSNLEEFSQYYLNCLNLFEKKLIQENRRYYKVKLLYKGNLLTRNIYELNDIKLLSKKCKCTKLFKCKDSLSCKDFKKVRSLFKSEKLIDVKELVESKISQFMQNIDELNEPFLLFIIGPGKYGKSTLINVLLESKEATVNDLPSTWKIDIYHKSNNQLEKSKIYYNSGQNKEFSKSEVNKILENEEVRRKESEDRANKEFKMQAKEIRDKEERKALRNFLKDTIVYKSPITEVHYPIMLNNSNEFNLLKHFRLVDTPGINQTLLGNTENRVNEYYSRANGVLWMLDAQTIHGESSKKSLELIEESFKLVGGRRENIIGVLNKIDIIEELQGKEGVEKLIKETEKLYAKYFKCIVPISAKKAYDGIFLNDKQALQESNILDLIDKIRTQFQNNSQNEQIEVINQNSKKLCLDIKNYLNDYKDDLEKNKKHRENEEEKLNTRIVQFKEEINSNLDSIEKIYIDGLDIRLNENINDLFKVNSEEEQRKYLNNEIVKINLFKKSIEEFKKKYELQFEKYHIKAKKASIFSKYEHLKYELIEKNTLYSYKQYETAEYVQLDMKSINFDCRFEYLATKKDSILVGVMKQIWKFYKQIFNIDEIKYNIKNPIIEEIATIKNTLKIEFEKYLDAIKDDIDNARDSSFADVFGAINLIEKQENILNDFKKNLEYEINKISLDEILMERVVI